MTIIYYYFRFRGISRITFKVNCYDGAAAMSGRFNGVQSIIKQQYKTAVYVHCSAYVLNLVICSSCEISCIRNAMGVIESIYNFMNTPKRQCVLQSEVRNKIPNSKKEKLMKLCATRWVEKHESIRTFIDLQEAIVSSLEMMTEWVDKETSSKATQLLLSLRDTTFNVSLLVIDEIFKHSYVLCKALQRDNIDLIEAMNLAEDLTKEVKRMRQNSDEVFSNIFMTLEEKSKLLNFDIHIPRICKRQTNRYNISTDSAEEYYRISIFTPFLDYFIDQMNTRFIEHQTILKGFQSLFDNDLDKDRNDILELLHFYKESDDLSDSDIVISELKMWKNVLNRIENEQKPKRAIEFLKLCDEDLFPNVYKLLKIVCILPVTTCTSERSFSSLRRLKTYLRSTMTENRLNGLAMLSIHREELITPEEVIEQLIKKNRRLAF
ncbi:52 kDa repressor of the inhibitor of the protein kinase-like [Acyrthosiphon pisum]|uniref:HAT C-terminal dimerisation domain-containing protein n=1 Tax=Acyrthosiphon pisum TaxID=7029 RepID=A0A8R2NWL7_ACYPI|nr:52 kDa repressor of the inhibitor of the protein kinase-like [Acyrthosiphon pisum]